MKLVSVVVPVFNAEKYLDICVSSLVNQTYKNLEIILINDGSTDKSENICNQWAQRDSRIRVIHQVNSGVSVARNRGIMETTGYYVVFMDSDDVYERAFIQRGVELIEQNRSEYLVSAFSLLQDEGQKNKIDYLYDCQDQIMIEEYLHRMYQYQAGAYWGANWGKIFLRHLIIENNIKFEEKVQFAEDFRFNLDYLKHVKIISVLHDSMYQYRVDTEGSLSKKVRNPIRYWNEYKVLIQKYKELYLLKNLDENSKNEIEMFAIKSAIIVLRDNIRNELWQYKKNRKTAIYILNDYEFVKQETKKLEIILFNQAYRTKKVALLIAFLLFLEIKMQFRKQ